MKMSGEEKKNRIWETERDLTEKNVDAERERLVNFWEKKTEVMLTGFFMKN